MPEFQYIVHQWSAIEGTLKMRQLLTRSSRTYRRGTARRTLSVEILSTATQLFKNSFE